MPDAGSRAWPWWALAALAVYAVLLVSLAFPLSRRINPDGVVYLRIAGYYLSGDLGKAVSGYWSPLYSWLLVPWLAAGVPGLLATKLLGALLALCWVAGVACLGRRYLESGLMRACLAVAAAVSVLGWSMEMITPDLLLAVLLTCYFCVTLDPATAVRAPRAFACGLLGGLAYLAKAYACPFFVAHFLLTVTLAAWAHASPRPLRRYAVATMAGMLGFLVVAGPWILVLSARYGRPTITTAASRRNIPAAVVFGATNPDRAPFSAGQKLARVQAGRITAWENPDEVVHAAPAPTPVTAPRPTIKAGLLRVILSNLLVVRDELSEFDYLHLALAALLAAGFMGLLRGPSSASGARYLWAFATVALYAIGYLPLWARESRYYWPVAGLLMVLSFAMAEELARAVTRPSAAPDDRPRHRGRWMARAALIVAASYAQVGGEWLVDHYPPREPDFASLAAQLGYEAAKRGTKLEGPLAGNDWPNTVYLAYLMNQPSYGTTTVEDPAALAAQLSQVGVRTYLVFNNQSLTERLKGSAGFRPLADLSMTPPPASRGTLAAFEVVGQPASR
jgi:hypothetical protein